MQNKHQEHPEDTTLTGDLSCLDWFITPGYLSTKMDGSVAIVWGIDPACGEFFVGTKAVFNKKKIRIAHNHEEIDQFYAGEVAEILHSCFDCLPHTDSIYQGDFIGFSGSTEYTPNTITYQFPEVVSQRIILAPHTCYYAESDLRDAVAMPDRSIWNDTESVKFVQPEAYIQHDPWSRSEGSVCFDDVEEVCKFARQMAQTVTFVQGKQLAELKKQLNACIREGREVEDDAFDCDANLIGLWKLIRSIKLDCLHLCRNTGPAAYINGNRIDAEGYVLSNEFGMFKLVNREVFAYANFNQGRFQVAH